MRQLGHYRTVIMIVTIFSLIISCSKSSIKIGYVSTLTGMSSELGVSSRNGAQLAVDLVNKMGGINGRKIELMIKDDKANPIEAKKVNEELMDKDVVLTIGHLTSSMGMVGLEVYDQYNKLMISPTISTEKLTGINDNFYRIIGSNKEQGRLLANTAIASNKRVAVIYDKTNEEYTLCLSKAFITQFEDRGGMVVYQKGFDSSTKVDFNRYAEEITVLEPEGVLIVAAGRDTAILSQYIKNKNQTLNIYTGMWAMTGDLIEKGGRAVEGIYLPGVYDENHSGDEFIAFRKQYIERFSVEPTFASMYSYEAIMMVAETLKQCNSFDTQSIKQKILEIRTFKGLQNDITIDSNGDVLRGYRLFRVHHGHFILEQS